MNNLTKPRCPSILLVEDDTGDQALTRRAIEMGNIEVNLTIANDGAEALAYLLHEGAFEAETGTPLPDLILLDLNLPKIDGHKVLAKIRETPSLRRIPVVALTTSDRIEDIETSYNLGVNSFVTKPSELDHFVATLSDLVNYWFRVVALPPKGKWVREPSY